MPEIIRTGNEIEQRINELKQKTVFIPNGVYNDEKEEWEWFCKGGITALRWVLGLEIGKPRSLFEDDLNGFRY